MTAVADAARDLGRRRHPVRLFLVVVVVLALLAVLVWWSGLVNPRLSTRADAGRFEVVTFTGELEVTVANDGPTPVEVVDVVLDSSGVTQTSVSAGGEPGVAGRRIGPGSHLDVVVGFRADDCLPEYATSSSLLFVTVRTPLGLARTESFPAGSAMRITSCGLR